MLVRTDLTDALIALIPEDGNLISNDQIRAGLEQEAGASISDAELNEIKALGALEASRVLAQYPRVP